MKFNSKSVASAGSTGRGDVEPAYADHDGDTLTDLTLDVTVSAEFSRGWTGKTVYDHLATLSLNNTPVSSAIVPQQSRIEGTLSPTALVMSGPRPRQVLNVRSDHTNQAHFTIASDFQMTLNFGPHVQTQCFSPEEAGVQGELACSPMPDLSCQGQIIDPLDESHNNVVLRDRAKTDLVQAGIAIDKLDPGEPIYLLDGYNPGDTWWWHVRGVSNPNKEGCVHSSVVDNYNNCPLTELLPPPPPVPQPGEMCFVNLPEGYEAMVYSGDGTSIRSITGPVDGIQVFGTSQDRSRFLISSPGDTLPQEWVNRGLLVSNPPNARACQDHVLGRFHYDTHASQYPQEYWNAVGSYAHNFQAPINPTQYQNEYHLFRNSYPYINPGHAGTDIVYRPNGNSVPFMVYSQHTGVIVDAGPDGITRTLRYSQVFSTNTVPSNEFAGKPGVFYWTQDLGNGNTQVTYFFAVTGENDPDADSNAQRPSQDYYPFGLTQDQIDFKLKLSGFEADLGCNHEAGCSLRPGQRVIIWYNTLDDDGGAILRPEIATVYYHVAVDQIANYSDVKTYCSRRIREETWNGAISGDPNYAVCLIAGGQQLGEASHIGFADAPHLHYEVYVDYDNDGQIDFVSPTQEREDPLMAFATIR